MNEYSRENPDSRGCPQLTHPELPGHHYTNCGGCQILPEKVEAKCDL